MAEYTLDAEDLLIKDGMVQRGSLGDIEIGRNLIQGKADDNVNVSKGYRLRFFDTFQILSGSWEGINFQGLKSSGFGFSMKGLLRIAAAGSSEPFFQYLGDHFDLQYTYSEIDAEQSHPLKGTKYQSISLIYRSFKF